MAAGFKREPDVIITVKGGIADLELKPDGVIVEIRDYDICGCSDEELETACTDKNGGTYFKTGYYD